MSTSVRPESLDSRILSDHFRRNSSGFVKVSARDGSVHMRPAMRFRVSSRVSISLIAMVTAYEYV